MELTETVAFQLFKERPSKVGEEASADEAAALWRQDSAAREMFRAYAAAVVGTLQDVGISVAVKSTPKLRAHLDIVMTIPAHRAYSLQ